MRFTHKGVEAVKPRARRFVVWDASNRGLGLRVTPSGAKSYVFAYRFDGKPRMMTLGSTDALTLERAIVEYSAALNKVANARHLQLKGETPTAELDPAAEKRSKRAERRTAPTVDELWTAYKAKRADSLRPRTLYEYKRTMKVYVSPELGAMKSTDVRPRDIKAMLNKVEKRGPVMANRVRALVAAIFNYAADQFIVEMSPVKMVRRPAREHPRDRALAESELRGYFVALDQSDIPPRIRAALTLLLATGARPGEVAGMRWSDVAEDQKQWTLPAEFSKVRREHIFPLSEFALEQIEACRIGATDQALIFPALVAERAMGAAVLSRAVFDNLTHFQANGVAPFRPHDLRRTCRTWLTKLGVARHVAEAVLGHSFKSKIEATYDTNDYLAERRAALDRWGAHLTAMRAGENVVAMKSAA
jgi:integrase